MSSSSSSRDSLFDDSDIGEEAIVAATREPPPIPGLFVFPSLLPQDVASHALQAISEADHFAGGTRDQVMLFTRADADASSSLPLHLATLDCIIAELLADHLPPSVHAVAFGQDLARQAILNLYVPGTGITPHVDLPRRYADGIVGVSLAGGCVMSFERATAGQMEGMEMGTDRMAPGGSYREDDGEEGRYRYDVYLPPRSVYVMSGPARWEWAHGIAYRSEDVVLEGKDERVIPRALRVSVTLRWMKEGAGLLS